MTVVVSIVKAGERLRFACLVVDERGFGVQGSGLPGNTCSYVHTPPSSAVTAIPPQILRPSLAAHWSRSSTGTRARLQIRRTLQPGSVSVSERKHGQTSQRPARPGDCHTVSRPGFGFVVGAVTRTTAVCNGLV
eukprot:1638212-Rhodomonas_salina.2